MACSGPITRLGTSSFEDDDRFLFPNPARRFKKSSAILDALDIKKNGASLFIHLKGFHEILNGNHCLIAASSKSPYSQALRLGKAEQLDTHIARL